MIFLLALFAIIPGFQKPDTTKPSEHTLRTLHGFQVYVDTRLTEKINEPLGSLAIDRLDSQLSTIALLVPADRLAKLRTVSIQLDLNNGDLKSPQYHPSADWLIEHGYDKALAKRVHIPDASYFANARFQREQPFAVLHELAHSYHDQTLGFDRPDILAAYEAFKKSGKYNSVLHISGRMLPHYALTDHKEFFAEMTETYFGANDFYPFNRAELQRDEPALYKLLVNIWGKTP